jgi:hypothetical protein
MVESAASSNLQADDISTFGNDDVGDHNFSNSPFNSSALLDLHDLMPH